MSIGERDEVFEHRPHRGRSARGGGLRARGLLLDNYPYSWLDPVKQGAASVATTIAMMVVLYALWAVALVLLDKGLGRRGQRG